MPMFHVLAPVGVMDVSIERNNQEGCPCRELTQQMHDVDVMATPRSAVESLVAVNDPAPVLRLPSKHLARSRRDEGVNG